MKIDLSSQRREMPLFLTTNKAAVTSRANQQYTVYQLVLSCLAGERFLGGVAGEQWKRKKGKKNFQRKIPLQFLLCITATLTCQLIYAVKLLFNIITVNSVKSCHKLNEVWVCSPQGIGSCIFRDSLWLFVMKSKLG